jgi:hypothetical protein
MLMGIFGVLWTTSYILDVIQSMFAMLPQMNNAEFTQFRQFLLILKTLLPIVSLFVGGIDGILGYRALRGSHTAMRIAVFFNLLLIAPAIDWRDALIRALLALLWLRALGAERWLPRVFKKRAARPIVSDAP